MTGGNSSVIKRLHVSGTRPRTERATVSVQGSKNCFNHLLVVGTLGDGGHELQLDNAPRISDRQTTSRILRSLGLDIEICDDSVRVAGKVRHCNFPADDMRRLRVSICYGAAVAAVTGSCFIPLPGGDAFTRRPIDLHVRVLKAAGAEVTGYESGLWVEFERPPRHFDIDITGPFGPSMGASVSALALAAVASGTSTIRGVSPEPEVDAVKHALRASGILITNDRPGTCVVDGAGGLLSGSVTQTVPGDRMEAATFIFLAAARRKALRLSGVTTGDLPQGLHDVLVAMGVVVAVPDADGEVIDLVVSPPAGELHPVDLNTAPHPGYPTDAQPQLAALLSFASGTSRIAETIYPRRTSHVGELTKFNVRIDIRGRAQIIPGRQRPTAGVAHVHDIRCGAALLVAAARATGESVLEDPSRHLSRGYAELTSKLKELDMHAEWTA